MTLHVSHSQAVNPLSLFPEPATCPSGLAKTLCTVSSRNPQKPQSGQAGINGARKTLRQTSLSFPKPCSLFLPQSGAPFTKTKTTPSDHRQEAGNFGTAPKEPTQQVSPAPLWGDRRKVKSMRASALTPHQGDALATMTATRKRGMDWELI